MYLYWNWRTNVGFRVKHLSKLLDVAEFHVGNNEEYDCHDSQGNMVFPQSPCGVLYSQVVQILLPCTSETETCPTQMPHIFICVSDEAARWESLSWWSKAVKCSTENIICEVYSRQACGAHAAVGPQCRLLNVGVLENSLLAELQTHKLIDL